MRKSGAAGLGLALLIAAGAAAQVRVREKETTRTTTTTVRKVSAIKSLERMTYPLQKKDLRQIGAILERGEMALFSMVSMECVTNS